MRRFIVSSIVLILTGTALICYAARLPIYTDADAPERLSRELEAQPRDVRFKEWYSRLPAYETANKRLSDYGRGLLAAGLGLLLATGFWVLYHRSSWVRTAWVIFPLWLLLWAARAFLSRAGIMACDSGALTTRCGGLYRYSRHF